MDLIVVLLVVVAFPLGWLGFLLWMAHLEDTLPRDVRRTRALPDPPPILAVPVRRPTPAAPATPEAAPAPAPAAPATPTPAPAAPFIPAQRAAPAEPAVLPSPPTTPPPAPAGT